MRIALLQTVLDATSVANNLQHFLGQIDLACDVDEAPDLLILPGACDTGGVVPLGSVPVAVLDNIRESIAVKAREWGVYIVAGLHCRVDGLRIPVSVLFDPDGDSLLETDGPGVDLKEQTPVLDIHPTAIGDIALIRAGRMDDQKSASVPKPRGVIAACPVGYTGDAWSVTPAELTGIVFGANDSSRAYVAMVRSARKVESKNKKTGKVLTTVLVDGAGVEQLRAESGSETILRAEVDLDAASEKECMEAFGLLGEL